MDTALNLKRALPNHQRMTPHPVHAVDEVLSLAYIFRL